MYLCCGLIQTNTSALWVNGYGETQTVSTSICPEIKLLSDLAVLLVFMQLLRSKIRRVNLLEVYAKRNFLLPQVPYHHPASRHFDPILHTKNLRLRNTVGLVLGHMATGRNVGFTCSTLK